MANSCSGNLHATKMQTFCTWVGSLSRLRAAGHLPPQRDPPQGGLPRLQKPLPVQDFAWKCHRAEKCSWDSRLGHRVLVPHGSRQAPPLPWRQSAVNRQLPPNQPPALTSRLMGTRTPLPKKQKTQCLATERQGRRPDRRVMEIIVCPARCRHTPPQCLPSWNGDSREGNKLRCCLELYDLQLAWAQEMCLRVNHLGSEMVVKSRDDACTGAWGSSVTFNSDSSAPSLCTITNLYISAGGASRASPANLVSCSSRRAQHTSLCRSSHPNVAGEIWVSRCTTLLRQHDRSSSHKTRHKSSQSADAWG